VRQENQRLLVELAREGKNVAAEGGDPLILAAPTGIAALREAGFSIEIVPA
jgi:siroheme synthase